MTRIARSRQVNLLESLPCTLLCHEIIDEEAHDVMSTLLLALQVGDKASEVLRRRPTILFI